MSKKKSTKSVETLTHEGATRKYIPTAEYQPLMVKEDKDPLRIAYERRNRDLDPQLVWRGKDEQDWSDLVVHAPPLYIQEKVHPKVIIDDLMSAAKRATSHKPQATQPDLFADFNGISAEVRKETMKRLQALLADRHDELLLAVNSYYAHVLPGTEELISTWPGVDTEIELTSIDFDRASLFISENGTVSFTTSVTLDVNSFSGMTPELYEAEKAAGFPNGHLEIVGEYFPGRYRVMRRNERAGTATFEITFTESIEKVLETKDEDRLRIATVEVFVASLTGV